MVIPEGCGQAGRKQGWTVTAGLKKGLDSRVRGCGRKRVQRPPSTSPLLFVFVALTSLHPPTNPLEHEVREGKRKLTAHKHVCRLETESPPVSRYPSAQPRTDCPLLPAFAIHLGSPKNGMI